MELGMTLGNQVVITKQRDLCVALKMQKRIMLENAELMKEIFPNGNHIELVGAAKITQDWIDEIEDLPGQDRHQTHHVSG